MKFETIPDILAAIAQQWPLCKNHLPPRYQGRAAISHAHVRLGNSDQGIRLWHAAQASTAPFSRIALRPHNGRAVLWCRQRLVLAGNPAWVEFTAPREDHHTGPHAFVYKVAGLAKRDEVAPRAGDGLYQCFQGKSADDIVAETLPA